MANPPHSYTIILDGGAPDETTQAVLDLLAARGYTDTATEILTRLTVTRPVRFVLAPGDEGIDVSRHNYPVDYAAAAAAGKRFAYLRASMGIPGGGYTGRDDKFGEMWPAARRAGLYVGAYHYFVWNLDGGQQADNFHDAVGGDYGDLDPVLDVEPRNIITNGVSQPETVNRDQSTINLIGLINRLQQRAMRAPIIYCSQWSWGYMTTEPEWLRNYRIFLADYTGQRDLPAHARATYIHQYKIAQAGELSWHTRDLDLDRFLDEQPPPAPQPEPTPLFRVRVIVTALNVRSGPGTTNGIVGTVALNDELAVWEVADNGWLRIHQAEQRWISGSTAYTARL